MNCQPEVILILLVDREEQSAFDNINLIKTTTIRNHYRSRNEILIRNAIDKVKVIGYRIRTEPQVIHFRSTSRNFVQ